MPDQIQIILEVLASSRPDDSCTLACFWTRCIWPNNNKKRPSRSDAGQLASGPDAFGPNLTGPSRLDLGQFCTIWSGPSFEEWNQIRYWKSDLAYNMIWPNSGCMLAIIAMTGHNQNASKSDLAFLVGRYIKRHIYSVYVFLSSL